MQALCRLQSFVWGGMPQRAKLPDLNTTRDDLSRTFLAGFNKKLNPLCFVSLSPSFCHTVLFGCRLA